MFGKKSNHLVVIENGQLKSYFLDNKLEWNIGRPSREKNPDIKLYSTTVSRKHGRLDNQDGIWFYVDLKGKNGTIYNKGRIKTGIGGRANPILLKHKDILIFGGGEEAVINSKTIWSIFLEREYEEKWRVEDTRDFNRVVFTDGEHATTLENPQKGTVIEKEKGIAIYMGDITYLNGEIAILNQ